MLQLQSDEELPSEKSNVERGEDLRNYELCRYEGSQEQKQSDEIENCQEESPSSNKEVGNVEVRMSKRKRWFQKLRFRADRVNERKVEGRILETQEESEVSNKIEMSSEAEKDISEDIVPEPPCDNVLNTDCETSKLCRKNERNFRTMEALGIFGLLTPAIAAVPATDEFDAAHKQIKADLGQDWELRLAAAHIDDALKGRGKYGKARSYFKSKLSQRCFNILDNIWYQRFFLLVILVHSFIIFIEPPSCSLKSIHFMVYVTVAVCLSIYVFDLALRLKFLSLKVFWSKDTEEGYWNGLQFILVCAFWIDFIILCVSVLISRCEHCLRLYCMFVLHCFVEENGAPSRCPVSNESVMNTYLPQPCRCLRLVMLLCRVRSIRHIFEVLAIIGNSLLKVLFIILIFIITFACIGLHLFMSIYNTSFKAASNSSQSDSCCVDSDSEETVYIGAFDNVGIAILRLFVLLSTENYPEIMLPALRSSSLYFFYFGTFVFFGGFFLTAILLAIVVDSYWVFAKKTVKKEIAIERAELAKAWNLLDPIGLGALPVEDKQFKDLFRLLKPKNTDDQNIMLIHLLDSQGDGEVDSFEWTTTLREALNAEFEEDNSFDSEKTERSTVNKLRKTARIVVESHVVTKIVLCLILLHGLLFCLKWRNQSAKWENAIQGLRASVTALLGIEMLIRIVGFGKQMLNLLEIIDILMMCLSLLFNCFYYIQTTQQSFKDSCVLISSLAVIVRWLLNSSGPRKAFRWFLNIVPVMFDLIILLFVILYLLATIAMEIFHKYDAPAASRIYPESCGLGFRNFWCSFLILFQTLTTSNWHQIMNLAHSQTKSTIAYLFFPMSYVFITMIVMNLFVAIAIEAANKLTRKRTDSRGNLMHQSTFDSLHHRPRHTFHESAKKLLSVMARHIIGSAREEETEDRSDRQPVASVASPSAMTFKTNRKGSTTIILSRPSKKTHNNQTIHQIESNSGSANRQMENEDEDEDDEDYSGLSPKTKREKQLKNKMKKRRKARQRAKRTSAIVPDQVENQVRAISSFRGSQPTDLELVVGDTITVLAKRDEWMQGECKGATGWFPASHVVNWSAKVLHDSKVTALHQHQEQQRQSNTEDLVVVNEVSSNNVIDEHQKTASNPSNGSIANPELGTWKKPPSSSSLQPNYRIKMKSGDWRREILGEMTVMNAEEMRELNKVMRAEIRAPGSRASKSNLGYQKPESSPAPAKRDVVSIVEEFSVADFADYQLREGTVERMKQSRAGKNISSDAKIAESPVLNRRQPTLESIRNLNVVVPTIETSSGRTNIEATENQSNIDEQSLKRLPTLSISHLTNIEFPTASEAQKPTAQGIVSDGSSHLSIDVPAEEKSKAARKMKGKSGEMPEWAKKFAETKNIDVKNVSFPEPTLSEYLPGSADEG